MLSIQRGPLLGVGDDFRQNSPDLIGSEIEGRDILTAGKRHLAYLGLYETRSERLLFRSIIDSPCCLLLVYVTPTLMHPKLRSRLIFGCLRHNRQHVADHL